MPLCPKCGSHNSEGNRFCNSCGSSLVSSNTIFQHSQPAKKQVPITFNPNTELLPYTGQERLFTLEGETITVSEEMDAFIHYRKAFKHAARYMVQYVMRDYNAQVKNLDDYFTKFPIMYVHYRRYLVDAAVKILVNNGIYDISREEFELELNNDFSKCNREYEALIEAFNNTIEDNQERAARRASLLPTLYFGGGVLGFAKALAYNAATTGIAEASIRNANVSQPQRRELFRRITLRGMQENLFSDFWDIHYSLTYRLNERGAAVWYPTKELNMKAQGLMNNISNRLIPEDKIVSALIQILDIRPHQAGCLEYIVSKYRGNPEALKLANYYGLEDEAGV